MPNIITILSANPNIYANSHCWYCWMENYEYSSHVETRFPAIRIASSLYNRGIKELKIICLVEGGNKNVIPSIFQEELTNIRSFIDDFDPEIQFIDIADIGKLSDMDLEDVIIDTTFGKMPDIVQMVNTVRSANIIDIIEFNCRNMSRIWSLHNVTKVFLYDTRSSREWEEWENEKIKLITDLYLHGFNNYKI